MGNQIVPDDGTEQEIERLVRLWQKRLGLTHWSIECEFDEETHNGGHASTWRADDYDRAKLQFNRKERASWTPLETEENVVHELLHLVTRDLEDAAALPRQVLGDEAARVSREAWAHAREGVVDRLANVFVAVATQREEP